MTSPSFPCFKHHLVNQSKCHYLLTNLVSLMYKWSCDGLRKFPVSANVGKESRLLPTWCVSRAFEDKSGCLASWKPLDNQNETRVTSVALDRSVNRYVTLNPGKKYTVVVRTWKINYIFRKPYNCRCYNNCSFSPRFGCKQNNRK